MKPLLIPILLAMYFGISLCNAQEFETWSSENGSSVEAKFAGLKWEQLYLENREGERMKLPLLTLAKEDRERAVAQAIKEGHLAASRTWTSKSETRVVASYSHFENNQLTLVKADGESVTLPLSALADADRKEAVALALAADEMPDIGSGTIQEPESEDQLATLADGKWKGLYAVYESPLYRIRILPNCQLYIDLMDNGEQVGPSFRNNFGASYRDLSKPKKKRLVRRSVLRIVESTKSAIYQGMAEIVIHGLLDDEISFTLTLSIKPNELNLSFETNDPPNVEYPTACGYSLSFPKSHNSPMGTKFPELQEALKGWSLKMVGPRIPPQTVQFWETIKSRQQVEEIEIVGPWGPRKLTVRCPPVRSGGKENFRVISVYPGRPIYNRFRLGVGYVGDGAKSEYHLKFE